ncbi:type III secretion system cytoplasmic ring protein SctQ [Desulfocurvus vexinensis]|uniref:type III secretion system cytoplasmic ring protein SctQ n=1 Tax=Desulfocurvus vexinensis TaxID=399548 RepID=UPI00048A80BA|nr:type III secretion system cytoplasmic ring protein SctQ [Desulfocurvus vexinensis]
MEQAVAYRPPALPARECRLLDALAGRLAGFDLDIGGAPWHVEPQARSCAPGAAPVLAARAGEAVWRLALGPTQALLDALGLPDDIDREALPEAVLWGVAEARLGGLLALLEALTGQPARPCAPQEAPEGPACCLEFTASGPGGQALRGWVLVPLDEPTLAALERALAARPRPPRDLGSLPVDLSIEAGRMTLTLAELRGAAPGDVLLPEQWHPASGFVHLFAAPLRVRAPWPDDPGQPWTIVKQSESSMSQADKTAEKAAPAQADAPKGGLGAMEIDVVFEIGRMRMTLDELKALGPGLTLPLPKALGPEVPVAILGNGRRLGTGRIVSVGETLGVQLTELDGHSS